jgi:5-methylthioadenosine/S-adenosylhomocysteine deaminase
MSKPRIGAVLSLVLAIGLASAAGPSAASEWDAASGILIEGATVVTMDNEHNVIPSARLLVRSGKIVAIWTGRTPPAGVDISDATVIKSGPDDLLYPGLINLHNHPSFNVLHTWPAPSSHAIPADGKEGGEPYANRYQWGGGGMIANAPPEYVRLVKNPTDLLTSDLGLDLYGEVVKYAEVAALLGGETSIQGAAAHPEVTGILAHNIDAESQQRVRSRVASIDAFVDPENDGAYQALLSDMIDGEVDAWLVHLAEGVDDVSRAEFATLTDNDLLTDMTVIVHGAALQPSDFAAMLAAPSVSESVPGDGRGAKLVWSPLSNLLLYGSTANFHEAYRAGVLISLGTDWSPSGSRNLLQELKIADVAARDPRILGSSREVVREFALGGKDPSGKAAAEAALDRSLVDMVTRNPALTLRDFDTIGSVEVGKNADLLLIRRPSLDNGETTPNVYRELIDATERDVRLVLVDGDPLAGDVGLMRQLKGRDAELVPSKLGDIAKAVDVTNGNPSEGDETLAQLTAEIEAGLDALGGEQDRLGHTTYSYLKAHVFGGFFADQPDQVFEFVLASQVGRRPDGSLNIEEIQLAPLFAADDDFFGHLMRAELDRNGLIADPTPPFTLYPANLNQVMPQGNPFAGWSAERE